MMINHIMCTSKILTDLCFTEQKVKTKNTFERVVYSVLVVKVYWQNIDCLSINGKQSVKVEKGTIEFENYFKQIPVTFKIYADFKCNLKFFESYTKKYQDHFPCSFAYKVVCIVNKFSKPIEFIKAIPKEYEYCKKIMRNTLTKIWSWLKKNIYFNKVTIVGFVKNW